MTLSIQAPIPDTTAETDKLALPVPGRVVVINACDWGGGAERVAFELSQGLLQRGIAAPLLVGSKFTNTHFVQSIPYLPGERQRADRLTKRTGFSDLLFPSSFRLGLQEPVLSAEVVHLHNLHGAYFSLLSLPWLSHLKPVVWTLHDMWAMTGNCVYSMECDRWQRGCGKCPQLGSPPLTEWEHTQFYHGLKRMLYRFSSLVIVTPSQWLKGLAEQSPLGRFPIVHIPNGIDTEIFRPSSKVAARAELELPQDQHLILLLANWLTAPWKGVLGLLSALQETTWDAPVTLLLVGNDSKQLAAAYHFTMPVIARGYVKEAQELARYYAAADVFLHPSRADNLPFTVLEAMACGTPVIASRAGGIPEEIDDGHTGLTTPVDDHGAMIRAVKRLLSDAALCQALSQAGREKVLQEFDFPLFIQRHIDLYLAIL